MTEQIRIEVDDLSRPQVLNLLEEHLQNMYAVTPRESVHAFDVSKLKAPGVTFWTIWQGEVLLGCGALKALPNNGGEIKSMRTTQNSRRMGIGRQMLAHIIGVAKERNYHTLLLETGAFEAFLPARRLYESFGFQYCKPFGEYLDDPNSVFMCLEL